MEKMKEGEALKPTKVGDDDQAVVSNKACPAEDLSAPDLTAQDLETTLAVLEEIVENRRVLASVDRETRARLHELAAKVAFPDAQQRRWLTRELRKKDKAARRDRDENARGQTEIREQRAKPVFVTPGEVRAIPDRSAAEAGRQREGPKLENARSCYVCKAAYRRLHFFYDQLCPACGDVSYARRAPVVDLSGRVALLTGARVKIGFQAAILLLRSGCRVVVTTRFPRDAAARYAREDDFSEWGQRLEIFGLDLRHTPAVEATARLLEENLDRLDFIIHNACQTVRRPPEFYGHLMEGERGSFAELPPAERALTARWEDQRGSEARASAMGDVGWTSPAELSQAQAEEGVSAMVAEKSLPAGGPRADSLGQALSLFPPGAFDADLQQVDLRTHNSWRLKLAEVSTVELLEVLLVNAAAPFVLSARLKPLMLRTPGREKHIVNVSAMEGQFNRNKTDKHPHTNMAKAALNMLTRTSAQDYVKDGIHMNAVDTGWVTDEDPAHLAARKIEDHQFSPPLDIVDGAARIVDPIFQGLLTGEHAWGVFFKDYQPALW